MTSLFLAVGIIASTVAWIVAFSKLHKLVSLIDRVDFRKRSVVVDFDVEGYEKFVALSKDSKNSFTSIFRKGVKLFVASFEAKKFNHKLAIVDEQGNVVREITEV